MVLLKPERSCHRCYNALSHNQFPSTRAAFYPELVLEYLRFVCVILSCRLAISLSPTPERLNSLLLLAVSCWTLYRSRTSICLFCVFLLNSYFNYSIAVGEHLGIADLGIRVFFERPEQAYENLLSILLTWNVAFGLAVFLPERAQARTVVASPSTNAPVVILCLLYLICALSFGIDRSRVDTYSVRVTAAFEYSSLVALLGLWCAGRHRISMYALALLSGIIIVEDLRFGGRITSIRMLLTFYLLPSFNIARNARTCVGFVAAVILMAVQGATRGQGIANPLDILHGFISGLGVFDTVVFSYYASAMHLLFRESASDTFVLRSLCSALNESFLLGLAPLGEEFNLTTQAAKQGFTSLGGGIAPSFLFFWGGTPCVILGGLAASMIYWILDGRRGVARLLLVASVAAFPRWYLYAPWVLPKALCLLCIAAGAVAAFTRDSRYDKLRAFAFPSLGSVR